MTRIAEVLFPDAADLAIKVVTAAGLDAHGRVPDARPTEFVRIRRVGGVKQSLVMDGAHLVVESWGDTDVIAHDNLQTARTALFAASGSVVAGTTIGFVEELGGPGDLPDPTTNQPRETMTIVFPCRGT